MSQNYPNIPLVVIMDPSESDRTATRELLINSGRAHVVGVARDANELGRYMAADPDIVLLDVALDPIEVPLVIRQLHEMSPRCQVVLTADPSVAFDLSRAMLAGARGVVH